MEKETMLKGINVEPVIIVLVQVKSFLKNGL